METEKAVTEIRYLNKESQDLTEMDWARFCAANDVPTEISTRVQGMLNTTRTVAGHTINIGKIIIAKIIEFVKANPNLSIGVALGAAVGALIAVIPFIGPMLAPLTIAIGAFVGGAFGAYLDKAARNEAGSKDTIGNIVEGAIEMAKKFFSLISDVFNALKTYMQG